MSYRAVYDQRARARAGRCLFGELVGPVDVVAARDDDGQVVGAHVRLAHELGARLQVGGLDCFRVRRPPARRRLGSRRRGSR